MTSAELPPQDEKSGGREPLSPARQKRLEKLFEAAQKKAAAASTPADFDFATELLAECVHNDPGNPNYVRAYIENLQKKYNHNKKGSPFAQFKNRSARSALKKAFAQEKWEEVILHGLEVLKVNPWDIPTLTCMAKAADKLGDHDCELLYLKSALTGNPKDPTCNRLFAIALTERGLIDQAIACWHRVEEALPDDEEAKRSIAVLMIEKARASGKFEDNDEVSRKLRVRTQQQEELTVEQRLQQKIQKDPNNVANYLELAELYLHDDRFAEAERLLAHAFELSDGDPDIQEKWEDSQLRAMRQKIAQTSDPETKKKLENEYFEKEVEVYKHRVERYPNNLIFRFELGYRYMKTRRYAEAIRELQIAQNDPRRKGLSFLVLGECFQQIKQYPLALKHYEAAIQEIPDREAENKRRALYLAGRLALHLRDFPVAEKHLTALAALDFTYKDVSQLLDKLTKLRENKVSEEKKQPPASEDT